MRVPDVVSLKSETNPAGSFYIYADPESHELGTITNLEFARATHRVAHLVRPDRQGPDGEVVALLALADTVLYHAVIAGLMTANFIPFPMSPRNSPAGIFHLLQASSCHHIIATCVTLAPLLAELQKHIADVDPEFLLTIEEIPSLTQVYPNLGAEKEDGSFQPYITETSPVSFDSIGLYLHSSGSTGYPKAIAQTHRALQEIIRRCSHPPVAESEDTGRPTGDMMLPPFHMLGFTGQLMAPLAGNCCAVFPPTATSPSSLPVVASPDTILDYARKTNCRTLTTVPSLLVNWSVSPATVAYLAALDAVIWAGGPLPQRIGDGLVDAGVNLVSIYGTTETGAISDGRRREEDFKEWGWFEVSAPVKVRWMPQGDGTFELQVLSWEQHTPLVENLDDVRGYATSDLCINHPQKSHLWKLVGRIDDTITHSSGEKTVPGPMEDIITTSPYVAGAVMFGRERPQSGILIELAEGLKVDAENEFQMSELKDKIWPVIEEANEGAPAFSRIFKEMILFSSPNKPLPRAGKGTVMRKAAIKLYESEIQSIYNAMEEKISAAHFVEPPSVWTAPVIQIWLLELAGNICNSDRLSPAEDLRLQGFDSLTATIFRLHIIKGLRSRKDTLVARPANAISLDIIYSHSTISKLATYLETLVRDGTTDTASADISTEKFIAGRGITLEGDIIEICSGPGIPLIAFPGAAGRVSDLMALRAHFRGTLWGLQVTESTPLSPYTGFVVFVVEKIREKQPHGPYRLAAYSGSSVLAIAVAKMLEESGEQIQRIFFIDGFPFLWSGLASGELSLREETLTSVVDDAIASITDLFRQDPLFGPDSEQVAHWEAATKGTEEIPETVAELVAAARRLTVPILQYLADYHPANAASDPSDPFSCWVSSVNAPLSILIAEFGMVSILPGAWKDLGVHLCQKPVQRHFISRVGHWGILADKRTAAFLQQ